MAKDTNNKQENEKLVENDPLSLRNMPLPTKMLTKKQLRREVVPYIRPHQVNGRKYYYYVNGADCEEYLGSAEFILKAVTMLQEVKRHGKGK